MPTAPTQTMTSNEYATVLVVNYDNDGTTPDTTELLVLSTGNGSICSISVDPTNNRQVKLTGIAPGTTTCTVSAGGVPAGNVLQIPVTVTAPPVNNSRVDFSSSAGPFPKT